MISVVRHDWAQSPTCHPGVLSNTHGSVSVPYYCVAERCASLLYVAASALRADWWTRGPDDRPQNPIVTMATDPTGTSDLLLIAR